MLGRFHIHINPAPPRVPPVGKLGIVDWREDCSQCHNCVKRACVYDMYRTEAAALREDIGFLDYIYQCKGCLQCVQNCTKGILTRVVNPEYRLLGDDHYTPDIVLSTWFQAETGRIPVSGAGYRGPFSGSGFDSMWTDMSEIVRPTRDGIHGREYINTSVDIGRKLDRLTFTDGELAASPPPLIEIPLPIIFDEIPARWLSKSLVEIMATAATRIGLFSVASVDHHPPPLLGEPLNIIPRLHDGKIPKTNSITAAPMVMIPDRDDVDSAREALKQQSPNQIVAVRLEASPEAADRVLQLTQQGAEVIHLVFTAEGRENAPKGARHMRDVLRDVHGTLVREHARDQVTLIASGGIALAEHVAKAIICGADLVAVDIPLILALECRLCGECERGEPCPVALPDVDPEYAVQRMVNLMGAWHLQMIEVLGAMGIREVRRLRGETGRAMFFEDLEQETFGRIFGKRKDEVATA